MKHFIFLFAIMLACLMANAQLVDQTYTFDAGNDSTYTISFQSSYDVCAYVKVYNGLLYGTKDGYVYLKGTDKLSYLTHTIDSLAADSSAHTWETFYWSYDKLILDFQHNSIDSGTVYIDVINFRLY